MQNLLKPTARREGLVIQELDDEVLVYDLNTNKAHCLNKTAGTVWKYCDGKNTVPDIAALLKKEFKAEVNEDLIWLALEQLKKKDLIANKTEVKGKFDGMPRREVLRKIGVASSLIALPIVASLVVPTASAQNSPAVCSGTCRCQNNQPTTQGQQCPTGGSGISCSQTGCRCIAGATTTGTNPGPSGTCAA